MESRFSKHPQLFFLSDTPIFCGKVAALFTELRETYTIHVLPFHSHQWARIPCVENNIIIFDITSPCCESSIVYFNKIKMFFSDYKILITGDNIKIKIIKKYIQLGANGYISKEGNESSVHEAIQVLQDGGCYLPTYLEGDDPELPTPAMTLPTREKQVLVAISQGLNNSAIAEQLFLSEHTIQTYRKRLFKRFKVSRAAALVRIAVLEGFL